MPHPKHTKQRTFGKLSLDTAYILELIEQQGYEDDKDFCEVNEFYRPLFNSMIRTKRCNIDTLYNLAKMLQVSMEDLLDL